MNVYIDVFFLTNFLADFTLLCIVSGILNESIKKIILPSLLGALYSTSWCFDALYFLCHPVFLFIFSLFLVLISFGAKRFIQKLFIFYAVCFMMCGFLYALFKSFENFSTLVFFGLFCLSYAAINLLMRAFGQKIYKNSLKNPCIISLKGKTVCLTALLDSGNSLSDPITKAPVMVAELNGLSPLFDEATKKAFINEDICASSIPLRIIPYTAIGVKNSLLFAFKPDYIIFKSKKIKNILVGVSKNPLDQNNEYNSLIGTEYGL